MAHSAFGQEAVGASAQNQQTTVALPADFDRVLRDYERSWTSRDSQSLSKLFAEDGFVLSPGSPIVRGRQAIAAHYRKVGGPLSLRAVAYSAEGSVGYIIGAFAAEPGMSDRGKFTLTLVKDGTGKWLIVSDMDNANTESSDCHPQTQ